MKKHFLFLFFALTIAGSADAGIRFSMRLEHTEVLQYESVYAYLTLVNNSDDPYVIDMDDPLNKNAIEFRIRRKGDLISYLQPKSKNQMIVDNITIMPDEKRELMIDLSKWYDMRGMGKYIIKPVVYTYDGAFEGEMAIVDVVYGARLTHVRRRSSGYYLGDREYQLLYWKRDSLERLFLRVDGNEKAGDMHALVEIGPLIRVMKPSINVSREGVVEVFHQSSPTTYLKTIFKSNYDGLMFVEQVPVADTVNLPSKEGVSDPRMELPPKREKRSLF